MRDRDRFAERETHAMAAFSAIRRPFLLAPVTADPAFSQLREPAIERAAAQLPRGLRADLDDSPLDPRPRKGTP